MADTKISALPASTTPLAGTEILPIVQSSTTKQVSVANLTAGRTQTSNGIVQGTAGTGYNFTANTPAAGMTSQLLNWYEEGTWTPVWGATTTDPTCTYTTQTGKYVRIGNRVTCFCEISTASKSGGTGNLRITGLPFTVGSGMTFKADYAVTFLTNFPSGGVGAGTLINLTGTILANEQSYLSSTNLQATSYLLATFSYFI
jgi:hypothetical protein